MWWIVGLVFGGSVLALAVVAWRHRDVVGYEDEEGFHYGEPPELDEVPMRRRVGE